MKIYFAGPLFSEAERNFNRELTNQLENDGFKVFLPQRDGVETNKPPYDKMSKNERRRTMFELDKEKIFSCDLFLFILDGRVPDEGACVELGMAYTDKLIHQKNRLIVGLQTDNRAAFPTAKLNPMLALCFDQIFETRDDLITHLNVTL